MAKTATSLTGDYTEEKKDTRIDDVKAGEKEALSEVDKTYGDMIGQTDKYYQDQIDAANDWANTQKQLQNEQTDFTIEQINQQKDQAHKDYLKEQSGAYVDWQKQSGEYGANAEAMAARGMTNTGYSESSQVSMYNTYQNRVATARESYNRAVLNYDNSIKEARLQNNSALAQIAYEALQAQLELSLQGFQYKNNLIQEQAAAKRQVKSEYWGRYQDVLDQIYKENALAEEKRQFDAQMAEEKRQFNALHSSSGNSGGGNTGGNRGVISKVKDYITGNSSSDKNSINKGNDKSKNSVDMNSVLSLGFGPISAKRAYELVQQGIAETYTKNGKTYFRLAVNAKKQFGLDKYR
jgi:hypothetical protein